MALRAGYYGIKRGLKAKLAEIAGAWDQVKNQVDVVLPDAISADIDLIANTVGYVYKNRLLKSASISQDSNYNGIVRKTQDDYTITADGTATGEIGAQIYSGALEAGDYILTGCIPGGSDLKYYLQLYYDNDTKSVKDYGNGVGFKINSTQTVKMYLNIKTGAVLDDAVFAPMVRDARIIDGSYVEPMGDTVGVTLSDHKTTINAIITAATGAADFAAFKAAMEAITPVTRSLSREASPEDVPEEVIEEEKPVTRKTTKKTVKEGE